ncbi:MAG: CoA transferase [Candidatus Rokubacteria bacterium]|nr:CoA transferase [Candidatus Rokubacteria bacterium]
MTQGNPQALQGLTVLDIATLGAGPWVATFLGEFGAEVIKVEQPEVGDHMRRFGPQKDGVGLMWRSMSRNKKCITLNLRRPEGQALLRRLVQASHVLVENFRPGTLEAWGIGYEALRGVNPSLVMLRMTGFGQRGPYSPRPGFGTLAEAMSGFAHVTGQADGPPTLPPLALADGVAAAFGTYAVMMALYHRDHHGGEGQQIDMAIYDGLMRLMEPMLLEYDQLGTVRGRTGNRISDAAPRNAYRTADGHWVAISGSAQPIAERILKAVEREDLVTDPRFRDNSARVRHADELDAVIGGWIGRHTLAEVLERFEACEAAIGPVYDASQIFADPHFKARESLARLPDPVLGFLTVCNVVPRLSATPGTIAWLGPALGSHNAEIYGGRLGLTREELEALGEKGVV